MAQLLQPFEEFKPAYVDRLRKLGRRWLVSQTYHRTGDLERNETGARTSLLFSDYAELGEAKLHLNAVKKDHYAAIIDMENAGHLKKIFEMLEAGSAYHIFFAVVRSAKELENHINRSYKDKLKQYIDKHTDWRITQQSAVKPTIQLSFGEIFLILKHGNQHIRIKFEEIER